MEYSSLFVTLMGIGTVFFGLICIIFLTMAMGAILKGKEKAPAAAAAAPAAAPAPVAAPAAVAAGETAVNSPMPGNIFKVECSVGQAVKAGDVLVVLEAMKMEIEVSAPVDGTVKAVSAVVNTDDLLVTIG